MHPLHRFHSPSSFITCPEEIRFHEIGSCDRKADLSQSYKACESPIPNSLYARVQYVDKRGVHSRSRTFVLHAYGQGEKEGEGEREIRKKTKARPASILDI